ncbi:hypothetical protein [Azospirillum rugosum]|uniref:Transposase IS66 family protein n=1 Tax=Azospirillum rugosum TaxID=416170 RepID=A0ABS4SJ60_9PROT|nr:hypothetical protein [Azospirillum rugosum]MBP2292605.1 hypothetical protein [Azospirillum rugosum]MDQ0526371.1 hypothetical protein [Azospirillum rugosum]
MVDFPAGIALDGCKNAYFCFRLARVTSDSCESRMERLTLFAVMARDYDRMVRRRGNLLQKWRSRIIVWKMMRACRDEGVEILWSDESVTPAGGGVRYGLAGKATVSY